MVTGYEQVRSVVAALAGDWEAARDTRLVLPETGVCNGPGLAEEDGGVRGQSGCCAQKPKVAAVAAIAPAPTLVLVKAAASSGCCGS
jgi:hypothetical protein